MRTATSDRGSAIPLLLTSSVVAHDPGVKLRDTGERMHHTLESVAQWLRIYPALPIVLCDGSNYDLQALVREKFPGANIECLAFENNQAMVRKLGRGYGEGEIVRYALKHSRLIRHAGCFAKCSSKLWVENFMECKRWWNGSLLCQGVFLNVFSPFMATVFQYIDTRFYISSISTYEQYFVNAHLQIGTKAGHGLEECFHDVFCQQGIHHSLLPITPVINGLGGGTGRYYKNSFKRMLKDRLRLFLVRSNPKFAALFSHWDSLRTSGAASS
jgi:hypothetical protein